MNQGGSKNGIGRRGAAYEREVVGISRVIIPPNQDRDEYLQHCYQCGTISMIARTNMDVVHDVAVDMDVMEKLNFPTDEKQLGSTVIWVNIPIYNRPVVVGILHNSDQMGTHIEENEFSFSRWNEQGQVSISGKARGSQIDIIAQSNSDTGGRLSINVSNVAGSAKLDVTVNGDFFMVANNGAFKFRDSLTLEITDGAADTKPTFLTVDKDKVEMRIQQTDAGFQFDKDTFQIGNGAEAVPLGETLESFLHTLIDTIAGSTTATSLGPQPLVNAAQILALKEKTAAFLSKYFKTQ